MVWVTDYEKVRLGKEKLLLLNNSVKPIFWEDATEKYYLEAMDRFAAKCKDDEKTGCIVWVGSLDQNGYGKLKFMGKPILAHRMAVKFEGNLPKKARVTHKCKNRACVNTDHLEVKTRDRN